MLIEEKGKRRYVLSKDFNTLMYDHTLHLERKHFCCSYLQAFFTKETFKLHIKDFFKSNLKQRIIMPKKAEHAKFKNYDRKIKSLFMIYVDFDRLVTFRQNGVKF